MSNVVAPSPDSPLIHVALVEDDVNFLNAFTAAIEAAPDMRLVSTANTLSQALQILKQAPAHVLVVDLGLPDGSGIEAIRVAHENWPECAIMVSTTFADEMHVIQSIEAGASGYLLKDSSQEKLIEQIRSLCAGGSPISPLIARQILIRFRQDDKAAMHTSGQRANVVCSVLSERELEVLSLITKGFTYDEIAKIMHVSRNTVMTYVRRIYTKLEVKSRTEAINEARSQGLLTD